MLNRLFKRNTEDRNFTDLLTQTILMQSTAEAAMTGALEIAAGAVSRAFASATASGDDKARFTPVVMAEIGRDLIEHGESAWRIMPFKLKHLEHYEVMSDGTYQIADEAPVTRKDVLHIHYHTNIQTLRGISPLQQAGGLATLLTNIEAAMASEMGSTVGYLLPVPSGSGQKAVDDLKADIARMKGGIAFVETTAGGWDAGRGGAPTDDNVTRRLGPNVPQTSVQLFKMATEYVLGACGVPPGLFELGTEGSAQRESWRRFLFGTIAPLSRLVETFAADRGLSVAFDHDKLMASDIAGRARAFSSLVQGGMSLEKAAAVTGLLEQEE